MSTDRESAADSHYIRKRGRISGPFSVEKLQALFASGQFGRFHEVSTDKTTWMAASVLDDIFASKKPAQLDEQEVTTASTDASRPAPAVPPIDDCNWYYLVDGEQQGPLTKLQLHNLIQTEMLDSDDMVWQEGFDDWLAIGSLPELNVNQADSSDWNDSIPAIEAPITDRWHASSRKNAKSLALVVVGIVVLLGLLPLVALFIPEKSPSVADTVAGVDPVKPFQANEANPFTLGFFSGATIQSVTDEEAVSKAVGLVICGISVVRKDGELLEIPLGTGSCFIISSDGYAVTNKHVIEQPRLLAEKLKEELNFVGEFKVWTSFSNETREAVIVYSDNNHDFAILKVDGSGQTCFRLSTIEAPRRGTKVYALGFPADAQTPLSDEEKVKQSLNTLKSHTIKEWVGNQDFQYTQTDGTVSRMKREVSMTLIQHNADINHGNSGGPLMTADGLVVGINTYGISGAAGVYYALPIEQFRQSIDRYDIEAEWRD
jgi:S1-C subfamily serine protease